MDSCTISLLFYAAPPVLSFDALPFPRPQIWSFCRGGDDTIFGGNDLGDSRAAAAAGAGARRRVPAGWWRVRDSRPLGARDAGCASVARAARRHVR